jgi:hypothetical protein
MYVCHASSRAKWCTRACFWRCTYHWRPVGAACSCKREVCCANGAGFANFSVEECISTAIARRMACGTGADACYSYTCRSSRRGRQRSDLGDQPCAYESHLWGCTHAGTLISSCGHSININLCSRSLLLCAKYILYAPWQVCT